MRQLLPFIAMTKGRASEEAWRKLQEEADKTGVRLSGVAKKWVTGPTIERAIATGQRRAVNQLGVKFGGVNLGLLQRLTREIAADIIPAAESPNAFANRALTRAQAVFESREGVKIDLDQKLTSSLIKSTLRRQAPTGMAKAMLSDLGLTKGDRILLAKGRTFEASKYAKLISRTRTSEALNVAKAEEYSNRGVEFIETSSHDVEDEDDICNFLQGKVWALGPNDFGIPEFPHEYGMPPWHPNCAHTISAYIPKFHGGDPQLRRIAKSHEGDEEKLKAFAGTDGHLRPQKTSK